MNEEGYASLAVTTYQASTIVYPDGASSMAREYRGFNGYTYGLHGTTTTRTLEAQLNALHGGVRPVLVPSGQAAVTIVMLYLLPAPLRRDLNKNPEIEVGIVEPHHHALFGQPVSVS